MSENNRWSEPSGKNNIQNSQWCNNYFRVYFSKTNVCDGLTEIGLQEFFETDVKVFRMFERPVFSKTIVWVGLTHCQPQVAAGVMGKRKPPPFLVRVSVKTDERERKTTSNRSRNPHPSPPTPLAHWHRYGSSRSSTEPAPCGSHRSRTRGHHSPDPTP